MFALLLDVYLPPGPRQGVRNSIGALSRDLGTAMAAGARDGPWVWFIAVVPLSALLLVLHWFVLRDAWLVSLILHALVLYLFIDFKAIVETLVKLAPLITRQETTAARALVRSAPADWAPRDSTEIAEAAVEEGLLRCHERWFAPIFWYVLLPGPMGALIYGLTADVARLPARRQTDPLPQCVTLSRKVLKLLDWLPARLTAITYALVGNFEEAVYCWRSQGVAWMPREQGIVLASGAGAMGVRLGESRTTDSGPVTRVELGVGDAADADAVRNAEGLLWRAAVVWLGVLLLVNIVSWTNG